MARNPKPIRKHHQWRFPGQAKFRRAMARLEVIFTTARPGTPKGEEFEQLAAFVSEWEAKTWGLKR